MKVATYLLAVDDTPANLFVLEELVGEYLPECILVTANSAEEGLAMAAERPFDGILVDVQMPGTDGLEMCRRLKAHEANKHLPILLITSHGSTAELRARGLEAGADDFISRPIDNVELVAKIRVMLRIKRAEDELRATNAHLEELVAERTQDLENRNAELERFAYTVSHDLKSPLITIEGFAGMLKQDLTDGKAEEIAEDLARIRGAVHKMAQLLDEVLELSRIGRLVNPPEDVALDNLVREAIATAAGQIDQRGVEVDVATDLPVVFGDPFRLAEVMQNLLDNAVKYLGDQPRPRIEIGTRFDDGEVVCYVRDNGIGIEPCYHERIFGLFDQLDRRIEGSGVGLALAKRIVEVHGGRIWVESDGPGQGSTFCFTIPSSTEQPVKKLVAQASRL